MAVNQLLVRSYASNIYLTGGNSFENIENQPSKVEYVTPDGGPVMLHAARNYFLNDIDSALVKGWITPQEHVDTIALKRPDDPQYRVLLRAEQPTE